VDFTLDCKLIGQTRLVAAPGESHLDLFFQHPIWQVTAYTLNERWRPEPTLSWSFFLLF